ncbi:MAG: glucan 1,4-alpha-glucosidase [Armatimonadetes bacterium]|nr:glucan 1,4-alpha-glucosidase [Armatimonadota bacterium]
MNFSHQAFGAPGIEPRWTNGAKEGVGTAYAASCRVWFTLWNGALTEVYYPTIDLPQIRDLQFLITDGETFFHEEKRDLQSRIERLEPSLGYRFTNSDPDGRYRIIKEIITDPHLPCVLQNIRIEADEAQFLEKLKIYALCAPHLNGGGNGNSAFVREVAGKTVLSAHKTGGGLTDDTTYLAMAPDCDFGAVSVGYVGQSDGWSDLHADFKLDWRFQSAPNGNVALTGEILAPMQNGARVFTLALAFGTGEHSAWTTLLQSLSVPFEEAKSRFISQWQRPQRHLLPLERQSGDGGRLLRSSYNMLLAHEDKQFPGALIASLSIPWGEAKNDEDTGGYHLVWPRDMVNSATGLLAAGQSETAYRAMIYLAASQNEDGGFAQNFWIDGKPYWLGLQLDEIAYPLLLVRQLQRVGALRGFDPCSLVTRAARFLVLNGPVTGQERWEEASGLSPSTLAAIIAGLISAASFLRGVGNESEAIFLEDYADWLESNLDLWCATDQGCLVEGEARHYVRIFPLQPGQFLPETPPRDETFDITSQEPGTRKTFAAKEVFDGGFLEFVRYGIRSPDAPLVRASVRVMDKVLRCETPRGTCFWRYNGDGYGQRDDGTPYHDHWGVGRPWPLLGGERGHYEIASGGDAGIYIKSLEGFASTAGLLPEQIWDAPNLPEAHMETGRSTGAARPLAWAHAEYIKLLRSKRDGKVFDRVDEAAARYVEGKIKPRRDLLLWNRNFPSKTVAAGTTLRIVNGAPFMARTTSNNWKSRRDVSSTSTKLGVHFCDIEAPDAAQTLLWTFFYPQTGTWEGRNYEIMGRENDAVKKEADLWP